MFGYFKRIEHTKIHLQVNTKVVKICAAPATWLHNWLQQFLTVPEILFLMFFSSFHQCCVLKHCSIVRLKVTYYEPCGNCFSHFFICLASAEWDFICCPI